MVMRNNVMLIQETIGIVYGNLVAVKFSHAEKEGIEANRRPPKNYYRDAFTSGILPGTLRGIL